MRESKKDACMDYDRLIWSEYQLSVSCGILDAKTCCHSHIHTHTHTKSDSYAGAHFMYWNVFCCCWFVCYFDICEGCELDSKWQTVDNIKLTRYIAKNRPFYANFGISCLRQLNSRARRGQLRRINDDLHHSLDDETDISSQEKQ